MAEDNTVINSTVSSGDNSQVQNVQETVSNNVPRETNISVSTEPEKTLTQSKVNELIGKTRQEERERAYREAELKYKNQQNQAPNFGGVKQIDEETARKISREEFLKQQIDDHNGKIANKFLSKIESAKSKYNDFDDMVKDLPLGQLSMDMVDVLNEFDNAGDIIYDLGKNPEKLAHIPSSPNLARRSLQKLSESIKANENVLKKPQTNPPLSQVSASPTGTDNGKMTIADRRKNPKFRG